MPASRRTVVVAVVATLLIPALVRAQSTASGSDAAVAARQGRTGVQANRNEIIRQTVDRWRSDFRPADPAHNVDSGEATFTAALMGASPEALLAAAEAQTYEDAVTALRGVSGEPSVIALEPGAAIPNELGSVTGDVVFTPITPCRIIDTRFATGGFAGRVGPNTGRQFSVNLADFSAQGGTASGCSGMPTSFDVSAVAINVTSTDQTGLGNIAVIECGGGVPAVSLLNYTPGVNTANAAVVRSAIACGLGGDIYIRSNNSQSHVVVDLMGYFAAPVATPPDQYVVSTGVVSIGTGTQTIFTSDCPAGYRLTGSSGLINSWGSAVVFIGARPATGDSATVVSGPNAGTQSVCQFRNDSGGSVGVVCQSICSRVPGR